MVNRVIPVLARLRAELPLGMPDVFKLSSDCGVEINFANLAASDDFFQVVISSGEENCGYTPRCRQAWKVWIDPALGKIACPTVSVPVPRLNKSQGEVKNLELNRTPQAQQFEDDFRARQHCYSTDDGGEEPRASKRRRTNGHCDNVGALGDVMTGSLRASLPPLEGATFIDPAGDTMATYFSSNVAMSLPARADEMSKCTGFAESVSAHASPPSWRLTPTSGEPTPNISSPRAAALDAETCLKDSTTLEDGGHGAELSGDVSPECSAPERLPQLPAYLSLVREVIDVDALDDAETAPRVRLFHYPYRSIVPKKEEELPALLSVPLSSVATSGHPQAFNHARISRAFKPLNGALECRMCLYVLLSSCLG